jgi:hypothetical protein
MDRSSGLWSMQNQFLPNQSTCEFVGSLEAKIPSANGERQILPRQTIKIFTDMIGLQR